MVVRSSALDFRSLPGRLSADPFEDTDAHGLSMRVVRLEPGVRRRPHRHPHSFEAIYVVEGSGHFWENGSAQRVSAGDCILVAAGVPDATIPDQAMKLICFLPRGDLTSNRQELDDDLTLDGASGDGG